MAGLHLPDEHPFPEQQVPHLWDPVGELAMLPALVWQNLHYHLGLPLTSVLPFDNILLLIAWSSQSPVLVRTPMV